MTHISKMEAVPRMPMIAFELKTTPEPMQIGPTLKLYIQAFYHEDPNAYEKETTEIDSLRQSAVNVSRDFMGCSTLKKYYSQLQFLQSRFKVELPFTWDDVYNGRSVSQVDMRYEQGCILYNIGALHSILGAMDSRQSAEGMKVSCTHFQCASWAFQHLRDFFGALLTPDITHEVLTFQLNLMLAQAQECILEKSMTDNRKSTITAKVAVQITEFYKLALKSLEASQGNSTISSKKYKDWKRRIEMKISYHQCVTYMYLGNQAEEQQKWGERVTYYTAALERLNECSKIAKSDEDEYIEQALTFTMDVVGGKFNNSKKDNDFVYHEKVPELESLQDQKGASLVKGIPFDCNDPEVSGGDIFKRLVPMEAHEAASLYSEEKAKLLRSVGEQIAHKNDELQQYLSSLQLDPSKITPQKEKLPQVLLEKCAAISVKPNAIKDLIASMQSLSSIATDVESNIREIFDLLDEEEAREKEFQEAVGRRAENVMISEIKKDCRKYEEGLTKAGQSNQELHKAMNTHIANLKLLSAPLEELEQALPSVQHKRSNEEEEVIQEMTKLMDKVNEMKTQRDTFENQFRDQVHKDDVTSVLVTRDDVNQQVFFSEQLQKHDKLKDLLEKNMTAQANILKKLTETNAKYAKVRKQTHETGSKREAKIQELIQSYEVYEDLLAKSNKGIEFYKKLENSVSRLLEKSRDKCKVAEEERSQIRSRLKPKGPPPSRPSAPKPGDNSQTPTAPPPPNATLPAGGAYPSLPDPALMEPSSMNPGSVPPAGSYPSLSDPKLMDPASMDPDMMDPEMLDAALNDPSLMDPNVGANAMLAAMSMKSEAPKLKDFLPFMKPKTFGDKKVSRTTNRNYSSINQVPSFQGGSLTNSPSASPVHAPPHASSVPVSPIPSQQQAALRGIPPGGPGPYSSHIPSPVSSQPTLPSNYQAAPGLPHHAPTVPSPSPSPGPTNPNQQQQQQQQQQQHPSQQQPLQQPSQQPHLPQQIPPGQSYAQQPSSIQHYAQPPQNAAYASTQQPYSQQAMSGQSYSPLQAVAMGQNTQAFQQIPQQSMPNPGLPHGSTMPSVYATQGLPMAHQYQIALSSQQITQPQTGKYSQAVNQPQTSSITPYQQVGQQMPQSHYPAQNAFNPQHQLPTQPQPGVQPSHASIAPQGTQQQQSHASMRQQGTPLPPASVPLQGTQQHAPLPQQSQQQQHASMPQHSTQQQVHASLPQQGAPQPYAFMPQQGTQQQTIPQGNQQPISGSMTRPGTQPYASLPNPGTQPYPHPGTQPPHGSILQQQGAQQQHASMPQQGAQQQHASLPQQAAQQQHASMPQQGAQQQHASMPQQGAQQQHVSMPQQGAQQQHASMPQQGAQQNHASMPQQGAQQQHASMPQQGAQQQHVSMPQQGAQQQHASMPQQGAQQNHASMPQQGAPQHHASMPQQGAQQHHASMPQQGAQQGASLPQQVQQQQGASLSQQGQQQQGASLPQQVQQQQGASLSQQGQQQGASLPQQGQQQQGSQQHPHSSMPQQGQQYQQPQQSFPQNVPQQQQPQASIPKQPAPTSQNQTHVQQPQEQPPSTSSHPPQSSAAYPYSYLVTSASTGQTISTTQNQSRTLWKESSGAATAYDFQGYQAGYYPKIASSSTNSTYSMTPSQAQNAYSRALFSQSHDNYYGQYSQTSDRQQFPGIYSSHGTTSSASMPLSTLSTMAGGTSTITATANQAQMPKSAQEQYVPFRQYSVPITQVHQTLTTSTASSTTPISTASSTSATVQNWQQVPQPHIQPQMPSQRAPQQKPQEVDRAYTPPQHLQSTAGYPQPPQSLPQAYPPPVASPAPPPSFPLQSPGQPPVSLPSPLQPIPAATAMRSSSLPPDPTKQAPTSPSKLNRQMSTASNSSSLDDILSSSPENTGPTSSPRKDVLTPKVITAEERNQQKEEELKESIKQAKDPYDDPELLHKFVVEVENYGKQVDLLLKQTLNGPTQLDREWKELGEQQEKDARKQGMAIARCYPMKNRCPDIMPYDSSRVVLQSGSDDYINASHIGDLSPSCPKFIATQAPLPATMVDFWQMVYEQGVEVIVMLCQETEGHHQKNHAYWPIEKGHPISHGTFQLSLQSSRIKNCWVERIITMLHKQSRHTRSVVHLQFMYWPPSGVPEQPIQMLQFMTEVQAFYLQQRSLIKPVVLHCSNGVGRSGTFATVYTGVQEINQGHGIANIPDIVTTLRQRRRGMVQEKEQLKFCYHTVLYYAQDVLLKRGIITNKASFSDKPGEKSHQRKPSDDILFSGTLSISAIQSTVAKMTIKAKSEENLNEASTAVAAGEVPVDLDNTFPAVVSPALEGKANGSPHHAVVSPQQHQQQQLQQPVVPQEQQPPAAQQQQPLPDPQTAVPPSNDAQLSLQDLQNPTKFQLDLTPPTKRKITKSSFENNQAGLDARQDDGSDPFSQLDPLWSAKP